MPVIDLTMERLDGSEEPLSTYEGKVRLLVNVASKCGLTPQYEALERLHETYGERGFTVLGFPANNFGGQEPGTHEEIAEFCSATYGVQFPMFGKISVKGDDIHPLYEYLTTLPEPLGGEVQWNFQKYLVDREGNVVGRYSPRMTPDDPELVAAIEALL
ncbi:MAG: glutathione peroxidase [Dehalococcoidia bacterium]|nr:glutathione peroxidase [Dehalococcoidia bacterium]